MARTEEGVEMDGPGNANNLHAPSLSGRPLNGKQYESGSKRLKVALACGECRNRKVRCDGVEPVCGACRRRRKRYKPNCVYPEKWQSGVSARYVDKLESRIQQLESSQNAIQLSVATHNNRDIGTSLVHSNPEIMVVPVNGESVGSTGDVGKETQLFQPLDTHEEYVVDNTDAAAPPVQGEGIDGMGNIGLTESSYSEASSSAASFMKQVKSAMAVRLSSWPRRMITKPLSTKGPAPWIDPKVSEYGQSVAERLVLPPRHLANEMMDVYWNEVDILYPFLVRNRFEKAYDRVWAGDERGGLVFCILNLIFALTCQVTKRDSPKEKAGAADIFYKRASHLLQCHVIGPTSLELIQCFLLMGQYLQSTEWPHRCWVVIGLAIRMGQGMGLYLPQTTTSLSQQDRELALRLWHGCVFMDRMVAMTLGRPTVIPKADAIAVPLPVGIDDKYLSTKVGEDGSQPPGRLSTVEFYVQSLKLYVINEETLSAMYRSDGSQAQAPTWKNLASLDITTIMRLDSAIEDWYEALPRNLRIRNNPTDDFSEPVFGRQSNVLRLRCLQVQILLFRPVLVQMLAPEIRSRVTHRGNPGTPIALEMGMVCVRKCIMCALEVIDIIYRRQQIHRTSSPEPLPAWWYEVFSAATALIPGRVHSYIRGDVPLLSLTNAMTQSLGNLRRLSPLSPTATRCLAALELLDDEILSEDSSDLPATNNMPLVQESLSEAVQDIDLPSCETALDDQRRTNIMPPQDSQPIFVSAPQQQYHSQEEDLPQGDALGPVPDLLDFTWLESSAADLLGGGYEDLEELYQSY